MRKLEDSEMRPIENKLAKQSAFFLETETIQSPSLYRQIDSFGRELRKGTTTIRIKR